MDHKSGLRLFIFLGASTVALNAAGAASLPEAELRTDEPITAVADAPSPDSQAEVPSVEAPPDPITESTVVPATTTEDMNAEGGSPSASEGSEAILILCMLQRPAPGFQEACDRVMEMWDEWAMRLFVLALMFEPTPRTGTYDLRDSLSYANVTVEEGLDGNLPFRYYRLRLFRLSEEGARLTADLILDPNPEISTEGTLRFVEGDATTGRWFSTLNAENQIEITFFLRLPGGHGGILRGPYVLTERAQRRP